MGVEVVGYDERTRVGLFIDLLSQKMTFNAFEVYRRVECVR